MRSTSSKPALLLTVRLAPDAPTETTSSTTEAPRRSRAAPASCATTCGSCCAAATRTYVYFVEFRGRGIFLRASPIDVSAIVRELLLDRHADDGADLGDADRRRHASATSARGSASATPTKCGCASEFDFARQAILYLPPRMPDPRRRTLPSRPAAR